MKNYCKTGANSLKGWFRKLFLIMRLSFVIILCCLIQVSASTYSQNTRLNIKLENASIKKLFKDIKKQSEFTFVYNVDDIENLKKIDCDFSECTVEEILDHCLNGTNMSYEVRDKVIIIVPNKKPEIVPEKPIEQLQQKSITGKVTDEKGLPLPGVSVVVKGTTVGITTDVDGNYTLEIPDDAKTLVFSFVGMKSQEVPIEGQTSINITLKEETVRLDEVVAIGYGTVTKKDLTGSISNVENISNRSVTNIEEAIQGSIPGVTVTGDGGDPTSIPKIKIRGMGTTSDESPLWVVDGVPYYGGPLNPFDIEFMTILKDASSAAIYGVRAAGGVILVTTKKGKDGALKFDINTYTGVQNVWNKPKALNAAQQAEYYNIAADNSGVSRDPAHDYSLNPDGQVTRTDWVDEIFRTGIIQNYDIGIRGENEKYIFSSSLGYNKKEGTLLNTEATRISFRLNSEFRVNKKLKIGENISYIRTNGNSAFTGTQADNGETNYNGIIAQAIKAPPHVPVYDENGNYSDMPDAGYGLTIHPVATVNRIDIDNPVTDLFGNLYLDYTVLDGLKFKSSFGINLKTEVFKEFDPRVPEVSKTQKTTNSLIVANSNQQDWSFENTILQELITHLAINII